jgi:CheY-like chemotaxis protein
MDLGPPLGPVPPDLGVAVSSGTHFPAGSTQWQNIQRMHAAATANAQGPVVLVVDDQPFFRAHLRNELARRGHTVITAENAQDAESLVEQLGPPLVIILDLMMPGTNGPELLHQLALREDADRLRFILVSAYPVLGKVAPNHRLVIGRLGKPIDLTLLAQKLEAASVALQDSDG